MKNPNHRLYSLGKWIMISMIVLLLPIDVHSGFSEQNLFDTPSAVNSLSSSMTDLERVNLNYSVKASSPTKKSTSSACSPVSASTQKSLNKANIKKTNIEVDRTYKQPKLKKQVNLESKKILKKLLDDIDFNDTYDYANELGFTDLINQSTELTYDNGGVITVMPLVSENISNNNTIFLIKYSSNNSIDKKSFLAKVEMKNESIIFTIFNRGGGVMIDYLNHSIISTWDSHNTCGYWACVGYAIEYVFLENTFLEILCKDLLCKECIKGLILKKPWAPTFCSGCIGCVGGALIGGMITCAIEPCGWYPCLEDCEDQNYYGGWEYYCSVDDDRRKHRKYYDYECSGWDGDCYKNSSSWQDDQHVESCPNGCNDATNNCQGEITCYGDGDCGDSGWIGSLFCSGGDVWQTWREYTCYNSGTSSSYCDYDDDYILRQECDGGECSSGQCVASESCEEYPGYPWYCNGYCFHCNGGDDEWSICCADRDPEDMVCCHEDGLYCDTSTGDCDVCGGEWPYECNNDCWGCIGGGEVCCPTSGDPYKCCSAEEGSVCMSDGSCCSASTETCNNQDDDCDGTIDSFSEGCGVGACAGGTRTCTTGSWGSCSTAGLSTDETCNNVDDDCDGSVDESLSQDCGTDVGPCVKGTQTCSAGSWGACGGSYVGPINETCNGIDDNCNNVTDEQNVCGNNLITINLELPENNSLSNIKTPTFRFNITNVNYTSFDCFLWLDNGTPVVYGNYSVWINIETSWNLTANKTVPDGIYYWWINCSNEISSNVSEKRRIIQDATAPVITQIQCQENGTTWVACSNILYNDNLTAIRVNCTDAFQNVVNVSYRLENIPDSNIFLNVGNATSTSGDWWVYNITSPIEINDSGEWNLTIGCMDSHNNVNNDNVTWNIPWGVLQVSLINPTNDTEVTKDIFFTFTSQLECVGGECGDVNATLDPKEEIVEDENKGHGNEEDSCDPDNPGKSGKCTTPITGAAVKAKKKEKNITIEFDRELDCHRCSNHKASSFSNVNMKITAIAPEYLDGILIDYYPAEWTMIDAKGGIVSNYNENYSKIEWDAFGKEIVKNYTIKSPRRTHPTSKYYFYSELENKQSDLWMVVVADPEGNKSGAVSTVSGATPFYTTDNNPQVCSNLIGGDICTNTWNVNATGNINTTYEFYVVYNATAYSGYVSNTETSKVNITVLNKTAPVVSNVILNSTYGTNLTTENLTVHWTSTDAEGDKVCNTTDWRIGGVSMANLNARFEADEDKNATDYSTHSNTPSIIGEPKWIPNGGYRNSGAWQFNGSLNYAVKYALSDSINITNDELTLMAWINMTNNTYPNVVLANAEPAYDFAGYNMVLLGSGDLTLRIYTQNGYMQNIQNTDITENKWHHIATVYNGTHLYVFVDGTRFGTASAKTGNLIAANNDLLIGAWGDYAFKGFIDDVRIYNRSLSDEQILQIARNRTDLIVSQETNTGENWSVCITPNDGIQNGNTVCSNNLTILFAPQDQKKFIIEDSSNNTIAWLGDEGNIVLAGNCTQSATCTAPENSTIFKDSADNEVAHIDSDGNLCIETGDCSDQSASCNPANDAFIIQDSSGSNVSYIDLTNGDLCLTGTLIQNGNP